MGRRMFLGQNPGSPLEDSGHGSKRGFMVPMMLFGDLLHSTLVHGQPGVSKSQVNVRERIVF